MNTKYNGDILSHNARVVKAGGVVESLDYTNLISEESKQITFDLFKQYNLPAICYSIRKLNYSYTGPAIRVRREGDNAELDIYYTQNNELNIAVLLEFIGGSNGFVTTWYDQSGNGRHLSNPTFVRQPKIVNMGNLITNNGKPAIYFDGTDDHLYRDVSPGIDPLQDFCVCLVFTPSLFADNRSVFQATVNSSNRFAIGLATSNTQVAVYHSKSNSIFTRSKSGVTATTNLVYVNSYLEVYLNNVLGTGTTTTVTNSTPTINIGGSRAQSLFTFMTGSIQELIMIQGKSAQQQINLQNNINSYYNIY